MEEQEEKEYQPESQNVSVSTDRIEISSEPVMDVPRTRNWQIAMLGES